MDGESKTNLFLKFYCLEVEKRRDIDSSIKQLVPIIIALSAPFGWFMSKPPTGAGSIYYVFESLYGVALIVSTVFLFLAFYRQKYDYLPYPAEIYAYWDCLQDYKQDLNERKKQKEFVDRLIGSQKTSPVEKHSDELTSVESDQSARDYLVEVLATITSDNLKKDASRSELVHLAFCGVMASSFFLFLTWVVFLHS